MSTPVGRLALAADLSRGKRVMDVGGALMPGASRDGTFARTYSRIKDGAAEYICVDYQDSADHVFDLNHPTGVEELQQLISDYKPEVILCMETLEHINYHFEVMNLFANAVAEHHSTVLITLPHNGNWVTTVMNWHADHVVGFFKSIAERFVGRSNLGQHSIDVLPCCGRYIWYWWVVWVLSIFQPISWAFIIRPTSYSGSATIP